MTLGGLPAVSPAMVRAAKQRLAGRFPMPQAFYGERTVIRGDVKTTYIYRLRFDPIYVHDPAYDVPQWVGWQCLNPIVAQEYLEEEA